MAEADDKAQNQDLEAQKDEQIEPEATESQDNQEPEVDPEEEKFQCSVDVSDSGPWKKKVSVTVLRAEIDKELDRQYSELRWKAEVPGFRKGRAPRRLVEKRYGEDITNQTKLKVMGQAFEQIEEEQDFEVLGEVDFDPEKVEMPEEGDFTWEYQIEVKPEFEMPHLEGVKIEKPMFEVTEERINEAIMEMRNRQGQTVELKDDEAQQNEWVQADVVLKVDGVDEEERIEDHPIRVDSTALMGVMIEDMGEILSGAKIGQTKNCKATVTDTHQKEEYRGKEAEFTIEVKGIRRLIPAELNEDFYQALGVSDEAELQQRIEEGLEQQAEGEIRRMMSQQVYKYFDEQVEFELPEGVAARHADRFLARQYYDLLQKGVAREMIDENLEKLRASSSGEANRQLKMSFIMEDVAEKLAINITDMEVNGVIAQIAAQYGRRPERVREELEREERLETLEHQIRDERAVDRILEMANIVDAPIKEPEPEEKPKKRKPRTKKTSDKEEKKPSEAKKSASKAKKSENTIDEKKETKKSTRKEVKRKPPSSDSNQ